MTTTRLQLEHCLACGHAVDSATSIDVNARPKPGAWTMCVKCGHLMTFDDELHLRQLTAAETDEAAADPRIRKIQLAFAVLKREEG
jgi:Zn ribbon nucleic-acid-binding protein